MVELETISLKIEFGGGLELLFSNQRSYKISIPSQISTVSESSQIPESRPADVNYLINYLKDNLLKERAELFVENGTMSVQLYFMGIQIVLTMMQLQPSRHLGPH